MLPNVSTTKRSVPRNRSITVLLPPHTNTHTCITIAFVRWQKACTCRLCVAVACQVCVQGACVIAGMHSVYTKQNAQGAVPE